MKKYFLFVLLFLTYGLTTCKSQTPPSRSETRRAVQNYRQSVQAAADTFLNSKLSDAVRLAAIAPHGLVFKPAHLVMDCQGEHTRGMTVVEWRVPRRAVANADIASVADEPVLRAVVLDALANAARA